MSVAVALSPTPILQFFNNAGQPNAGGSVLTQVGGVNYPAYQDAAGTIPLPNPIPLNSRGEISNASGQSCQLFLAASVNYVFIQYDSLGNQINEAQYMAPSGLNYTAPFTGAVSRTVSSKLQESVSVLDFGADFTGATDCSAAFQNAVNALPALGGKISVQPGTWNLTTPPTWAPKSVFWDISPSAIFTGSGIVGGSFPYMVTNPAQLSVGPYIQSNSETHSTVSNGGIAAFQVEMLQPSDYGAGQSVAIYAGASGSSSNANANVWAINSLISVESTAAGTYQCIEVDVNTNSTSALVKGISISGAGSANPDVGLELTRLTGLWGIGVHLLNTQDAIVVGANPAGRGAVFGNPTGIVGAAVSAQQYGNDLDTIILQRNSDTSPSGYFIRGLNANNTENLFLLDALGNFSTNGIVSTANLQITLAANPTNPGQLSIGAGVSTTASSGVNGAVPAQVAAYIEVYSGSTMYKIPLFNV